MFQSSAHAAEPSYLNWDLQQDYIKRGVTQLSASNFQDIFTMTKRVGEVEVKMSNLRFRAGGIGGMLGIAAGALGGPIGSVVGFGVGRAVGGFVGSALANRYYGEEKNMINENLHMAKMRDTQLKFQVGQLDSLGQMIGTLRQNRINDDKKIIQDMLVL
jgi:outer membrane lipoprotein SlyB